MKNIRYIVIAFMLIIVFGSCNDKNLVQENALLKRELLLTFGSAGAVYKIRIDSVEYVLVKNGIGGCAITRHSK